MRTHRDMEKPQFDDIFVFGSNLEGRHGKGAALAALKNYGAVWGNPRGHQGKSYAVPTVITPGEPLSLADVEQEIVNFCLFAHNNPELHFFLTRVGCGLAGFKNEQIAPLFDRYLTYHAFRRCSFPTAWVRFLREARHGYT